MRLLSGVLAAVCADGASRTSAGPSTSQHPVVVAEGTPVAEYRLGGETRDERAFALAMVVFVVLAGVLIVAMAIDGQMSGGGGSSRPTSSRQLCEQRWEENRATADNGVMTRDIYISNCMQTNSDLSDGSLDGK